MKTKQNNVLPPHWKVVKLGEVCKLKNGFAFKSSKYSTEGAPIIRISDINEGIVSTKKSVRVKPEKDFEAYKIESNSILVAMSGATTGKFGIFRSSEKAYQNQRVGKFSITNAKLLNNEFLFYLLHSLKRQIEKDAYGGAQPNISSKKIEEMSIPLPPLPEQQRIVAKIEELFSGLDKGIASLQQAKAQLKTYRQSVLKWAFEGKLTEDWRKRISNTEYRIANDELNLVAEEREVYSKNTLPNGWKTVQLKEVTEKITDGEHFRPKTQESGVPFLSAKDVRDEGVLFNNPLYISEETAQKALQRCNPRRGDILIVSRGATVGRMCVVNTDRQFCLLGSVILIKVNKDINSKFFNYVLKSPIANQKMITISGATAQQAIYLRDIKNIAIPLAPIEEQHQIVQQIESRLSVADKLEESIEQSLQQAEALRQSILKRAFEGKLTAKKV